MRTFLSIVDVNQILQQNFDMYWSDEKIFEFISKYEEEPVLWNPKNADHKRKKPVFDAWVRIKRRLGWGCTIMELKKKRASLMATYRQQIQLKKISMQISPETADKNTVNWFAFGALHKFLQPIYDTKKTIKIGKEQGMTPAEKHGDQTGDENSPRSKRARRDFSSEICGQQMNETEEELFGTLIANKLRRIQNTNAKEILMNNIHNMIFNACMEDRLYQSRAELPETIV